MTTTSCPNFSKQLERIQLHYILPGFLASFAMVFAVTGIAIRVHLSNDPFIGTIIVVYGILVFAYVILIDNRKLFGTIHDDAQQRLIQEMKIFTIAAILYTLFGITTILAMARFIYALM